MKLVGLSGYAGSGKDEVGRLLVERHGFVRFAKGDLIKDAALGINPALPVPLRNLINDVGWEGAKEFDEIRRFLQDLADEVVRVCGCDVWNDALYEKIERTDRPVVLTRLSLPIEAQRVLDYGGEVWRIDRPGFGPVNDHPNETALDDWEFDYIILNGGTLDELASSVAFIVSSAAVPSSPR